MRNAYVIAVLAILLSLPVRAHALPMQQSTAAEGSHVFTGNQLVTLTVNWNAATTARYLMIFDGPLPSNGATTNCSAVGGQGASCLAYCSYASNSGVAPSVNTWNFGSSPVITRNNTGLTAAMSTGAGCGTLTVDGSNDFFYAQVLQGQ